MPQPFWSHACAGREVLADSPECHACGSRGTFEGWRLGTWEAMRLYYHVFGLNPIGPHRPLADQVFAPMRDPCIRCGGRAVLSLASGAWSRCPACEGTGGIWNRPFHEVDAAWGAWWLSGRKRPCRASICVRPLGSARAAAAPGTPLKARSRGTEYRGPPG